MALSNIFREPRREITETLIGLPILAAFCATSYGYTVMIYNFHKPEDCPYLIALFFGAILTALTALGIAGLAMATHAIGESICNGLEKQGIRLRPRQRY